MIKIDDKQLKNYIKSLEEAGPKAKGIISGILNSHAFKTREYDIKNISQSMVIRDTKFMTGSLRVEKASKTSSINSMIAIAGSINRKGFSGWKEQQDGGTPKKRRGYTPGARNGNFKNKTVGTSRLKSGQKFSRPTDFNFPGIKSENQKIGLFLKIMMDRKNKSGLMKEGKSFVLPKYKGFERGLYNYKNHKFTKYQEFDKANRPVKSNKWRSRSLSDLYSKNDIDKLWTDGLKRIFNRKPV
jgi:hypothetical protein